MIAKRPVGVVLCVLLMLLFVCFIFSSIKSTINGISNAVKRPGLPITISEETTVITEPLRENGYVNYAAALNRVALKGVTPENNAAVLFWQAVGPSGPKEMPLRHPEEYFKQLEMPPLAPDGNYFIAADDYLDQTEDVQELVKEVIRRPWREEEFPKIAEWIDSNEEPLSLLVEASRRSRRFDPLLCSENCMLIAMPYPAIFQYRDVVHALLARAMLRLGDGTIDEAWEDILACHRFARLSGQGVTLLDALMAINLERTACRTGEAMLQHGSLTTARIDKMRADLKELGPMPKMVEIIDTTERYGYLDSVSVTARQGISTIDDLSYDASKSFLDEITDSMAREVIDWDLMLRRGNYWYDRMAEAFAKPTWTERRVALLLIEADVNSAKARPTGMQSFVSGLRDLSPEVTSKKIADIMTSLLMSGIMTASKSEYCGKMRFQITELTFALAAYRADNDSYPAKLADLMPKYVDNIPEDVFIEKPLKYERKDSGYLLYSVGPNGIDENGRGREDCEDGDEWDDIAVEMQ